MHNDPEVESPSLPHRRMHETDTRVTGVGPSILTYIARLHAQFDNVTSPSESHTRGILGNKTRMYFVHLPGLRRKLLEMLGQYPNLRDASNSVMYHLSCIDLISTVLGCRVLNSS